MFYVKIATPLKKVIPLFPIKPPLKIEVLSSPPPPFENLVGRSTPLRGWGCTLCYPSAMLIYTVQKTCWKGKSAWTNMGKKCLYKFFWRVGRL